MKRPDWQTYFGRVAQVIASRATCPRAQCGAVIVKDKRIVSTGYNGAPPGQPHCMDEGCLIEDGHCQTAIHAEVNAIVHAKQDISGATIYVYKENTGSPFEGVCRECMKVLRAANICDYVYCDETGVRWSQFV